MALYGKFSNKDGSIRPLRKVYKKIGIRRDRDLGDLSSSSKSLENLLDQLASDVTGFTFLASDLTAISNIYTKGLTNSNYLNIAGSSIKFSTPSGVVANFDPVITYQNRLDKIRIFSGEPRLNGGDGLTALYFQNDQINFNTDTNFDYGSGVSNFTNTFDSDIFTLSTSEGSIPPDKFWEAGNFDYSGKIHPQSTKTNSGVKWEGYYVPKFTGKTEFSISCTGYFTADFQQIGYAENDDKNIISTGIGTYKEYSRVGVNTSFTVTSAAPSFNEETGNEITVGSSDLEKLNTIGIGMSVSGANINSVDGAPTIESIDRETGVIKLSPAGSQNFSLTAQVNNSVTFFRALGVNVTSRFSTHFLSAYQKYRIRLRYFHPKSFDSANISRSFNIDFTEFSGTPFGHLRYNRLFPLDHDFSDSVKGEFNTYFDNSVLFGGTNLSGIGNNDSPQADADKYAKVTSNNKINIVYKVKSSISQIKRRENISCVLSLNSRVFSIGDTSNIEIGNYIFGDGIPEGTRVEQLSINTVIIMDKEATVSGTNPLTFIDHRGFVKRIKVNATTGKVISAKSDTPVTATTPNFKTAFEDVQKGMIAISDNFPSFASISATSAPSGSSGGSITLDISSNVTTINNQNVFIYQSRGLKDNSLLQFCDKFTTGTPTVQCLISSSVVETEDSSGNPIVVVPVNDLGALVDSNGNLTSQSWTIQGFNFETNSSGNSVVTISSVNSNAKTITLSSTQSNKPIQKRIVSGTQFTATTNSGDYQLCCPPTDTSPPFTATEEGLKTPTNERPNLRLESGNLKFDQLLLQDNLNPAAGNAIPIQSGDLQSANRTIEIQTPLSTGTRKFKILATTNASEVP